MFTCAGEDFDDGRVRGPTVVGGLHVPTRDIHSDLLLRIIRAGAHPDVYLQMMGEYADQLRNYSGFCHVYWSIVCLQHK